MRKLNKSKMAFCENFREIRLAFKTSASWKLRKWQLEKQTDGTSNEQEELPVTEQMSYTNFLIPEEPALLSSALFSNL